MQFQDIISLINYYIKSNFNTPSKKPNNQTVIISTNTRKVLNNNYLPGKTLNKYCSPIQRKYKIPEHENVNPFIPLLSQNNVLREKHGSFREESRGKPLNFLCQNLPNNYYNSIDLNNGKYGYVSDNSLGGYNDKDSFYKKDNFDNSLYINHNNVSSKMLFEKFFNNNCHSVNQYIPDYQNQKDHHYLQKNNDSNVFDFYNRPNYFDNLNSQIVEPKKIYKNDALSVQDRKSVV